MLTKLQAYWEYIQFLLDISGDAWMSIFTAIILMRIGLVLAGHSPLTPSESACYASAISAFAYSNRGPK